MMNKIGILFLCFYVGVVNYPVCAREPSLHTVGKSGLSLSQAKQVLRLVLKHSKIDLLHRPIWIDGPWIDKATGHTFYPGYYSFGVIDDNPGGGMSMTLGHYSVNIRTGDVWQTESVSVTASHLSSPFKSASCTRQGLRWR